MKNEALITYHITRITSFIITSFRIDVNSTKVFAFSPILPRIMPTDMEKTIMPKKFGLNVVAVLPGILYVRYSFTVV